MLKIRLKLLGKKKKPLYSIVLINSKKQRNGKIKKNLGFVNRQNPSVILNLLLIKQEIQNGAQMTLPIKKLIINQLLFDQINKI